MSPSIFKVDLYVISMFEDINNITKITPLCPSQQRWTFKTILPFFLSPDATVCDYLVIGWRLHLVQGTECQDGQGGRKQEHHTGESPAEGMGASNREPVFISPLPFSFCLKHTQWQRLTQRESTCFLWIRPLHENPARLRRTFHIYRDRKKRVRRFYNGMTKPSGNV